MRLLQINVHLAHHLGFIICAPEAFRQTLVQTFDGLDGGSLYIDDILVWAKNKEERDVRLKNVLLKAR